MTVKRVHLKSYRHYDSKDMFDSLMEFACMTDGTSMNAFLKTREKIARTSFLRFYNKSGLADLKEKGQFDAGIATHKIF